MLKLVMQLTRSVRGHFVTLIEVCMHVIEFNPEHISFSLFQCLFVCFFHCLLKITTTLA